MKIREEMMKTLLMASMTVFVCGFNYEAGYEHHYTYSSATDTLGMHNFTTVLKFRIQKVNETDNGLKFHLLTVDSFVQYSQSGHYADNPLNWNLKTRFLFEMEPDGLVNFIHYHPSDTEELITLKKAVTGIMAAKFKVADNQTWTFSSKEKDHTGHLEHYYEGRRTNNGYMFTRSHASDELVFRIHNKIMHLDHTGNIQKVFAHDNITMKRDVNKRQKTVGNSVPLEKDLKVYTSGEFPSINAVANTHVQLATKRRVEEDFGLLEGLVRDCIIVTKKLGKRTRLNETENIIDKLIACVHSHEDKFAPNRTLCVRNLTRELGNLEDADLWTFSHKVLKQKCNMSDAQCLDERYLMLDVISQVKSNASQEIIVEYILARNSSAEDLRRCLVQCVSIKKPIPGLIESVEMICFGKGDSLKGKKDMSVTQRRACLTLGALAHNLRKIGDDTEAQRIVDKFETWLGIHNESEFIEIVKPRQKRSVEHKDSYSKSDTHVALKRTLLHSLGNAAHPRSLTHIASYMELRKANPSLRRTAAHALRHFTCNKSAAHLLRTALFDSEDVVRQGAYEIYREHPESKQLTKEQEDAVLEQRYTYPLITRVRRGTFSDILKALSFHLGMPKFEWGKTLGPGALGTSFGISMENFVDLNLEPFQGKFEIKVDNFAFADVNVGLIGQKFDIFRITLCFKKIFEYDLNILKDFGFDDIQNIASAFDKLYHKIVDPIVDAVNIVKDLINMVKNVSFPKIIETIMDIFKSLPDIVMKIVFKIKEVYGRVTDFDGFPLVTAFKKLIMRITTFISDIKSDVLEFYHSIADAITVTLPFIGEEIAAGFNLIKDSWKFWEDPMGSFRGIGMALLKFKLAVVTFIEAKNRIMDACFFTQGRTPYWFNPGEEIRGILNDLKQVLKMTVDEVKDVFSGNMSLNSNASQVQITDGFNVKGTHSFIKLVIKEVIKIVEDELSGVLNIAKPFWEKVSRLMDMFQKVKNGYYRLREVIETGKYYMQKLFGSKFHSKFPKIPATCRPTSCGCGKLHTDNKGRVGMDLNFSKNITMVVNPFHGSVYRKSNTEVLVRPTSSDMKMYEVVITGFNVDTNLDPRRAGVFKKAGNQIGQAKPSKCKSGSFVFVAIRHRLNDTESETRPEADYEYIDPTPYLKRRIPIPGFQSICNEFSFYYIGMVTEEGETTKKPKGKKKGIRRSSSKKSVPNFEETSSSRKKRSVSGWLQGFKDKFTNLTGRFDKFRSTYLPNAGSNLPGLDIDSKPLTFIKYLLEGSDLVSKLDDIVKKVAEELRTEPIVYPEGMPLHQLRRKLKKAKTLETATGDRLSMIDKLLEVAVQECPSYLDSIVPGYGHYCEAHEDCHGITCGVVFSEGFQRHLVKMDLRVDSCENQLHLTVFGKQLTVDLLSEKKIFVVEVPSVQKKELVMDLEMIATEVDVRITLSGALCVSTHYSCFEDVEILRELTVDKSEEFCSIKETQDPYVDRVYGMTLADLLEDIIEFGLDVTDSLRLINEIRSATLEAIMTKDIVDNADDGFPEKMDICLDSGPIALPHQDIQIIPPSNPPEDGQILIFLVGPVPLTLQFGASARLGVDLTVGMCIMSMKAQAQIIPYLGSNVWGQLNIDFGIIYAGMRFEGSLIQTKIPVNAAFGFGKFPLQIGFRLDLEIIPLEMQLSAYVKLRLFLIDVTLFDAPIYKFRTPAFRTTLVNIPYDKKDPNPPQISSAATNVRRRRSASGGCEVKQIEGRDPTDTAFLLEVSASSDVSDIKLVYAIGTHLSGRNVQDWTDMKGNSITAPFRLMESQYGIPLYFTIKAKNSQGTAAITQCQLNTYDNTVPDGRIDESYPYTSHPHKVSGNVIVFEDSVLDDKHVQSISFSKGELGPDSIVLEPFILESTTERQMSDMASTLRFFTVSKKGKLTSEKIYYNKTDNAAECAQLCLTFGKKCVSFDYEYHSENCDLHATIEGPRANLRISGTYEHYERLGVGYSSFIEHNIDLKHGTRYFLNAEIGNVLEYKGIVSSQGTTADFTPPDPGPVGNTTLDEIKFYGCNASIIQRCVDITDLPNHRKIIDGPDGNTVFNGHEGGVDTLYTLANHFISANWDGFYDTESGIYGYTWSAGTTVCGTNITNFSDPHAHLSSTLYWTNKGYARNIHLPDGPYYVSVQAVNNVVHGGAMVTTVCHSTPITVDTTPPIFMRGVTDDDIVFDEDFSLMALYFSAYDPESKIKSIEYGLGLTKHDVDVRGYTQYDYRINQTFVVVRDLNLASGKPVWIRLKARNKVELPTTTHSDNPILIDRTPPVAGIVYDGNVLDKDLKYQSDNTTICAQWKRFYDPESGITEYQWGLGSSNGKDDIVSFVNHVFSRDVKESCADLPLVHNKTYYSTVIAKNSAINPKTVSGYSDGVLIDITPPVKGWVKDGSNRDQDMEYSSDTAKVSAVWGDFSDPESGIVSFMVEVSINGKRALSINNGLKTEFTDYTLSVKHGDTIYTKVTTKNGADETTELSSNGYVIDQTAPAIKYLYDNDGGYQYQNDKTKLHLKWEFDDLESGIKQYQYFIQDIYHGQEVKFYPKNDDFVTLPIVNKNTTTDIVLSNLKLENGHKYLLQVTAINNAGIPRHQESKGVIIDNTPPELQAVHLGLQGIPEEINDGFIIHDDPRSLTLTWISNDFESKIIKSFVAVGISPEDTSITGGFGQFGPEEKVVINDLNLAAANAENPEFYFVQVKVQNGAGMFSEIRNLSFPIKILKENEPGVVFDGGKDFEDSDFTFDKASIRMSFYGFESEQCGIVGYEWGIGSQPFYYDVLPFTEHGIVLMNDTHGQGQIHIKLNEGSTYFVTVRARTGHRCKTEYILSSSDGITLDTTPPKINLSKLGQIKKDMDWQISLYQNKTDSLEIQWESKNSSDIDSNWWSIGSLPGNHDVHQKTFTEDNFIAAGSFDMKHRQTFFVNIGALDKAGNEGVLSSPSITVDTSSPEILNLSCTSYISVFQPIVHCNWDSLEEAESTIKNFSIGIGSGQNRVDITNFSMHPIHRRYYKNDLLREIKNENFTNIYVIFKFENSAGISKTIRHKVIIDRTIPYGGKTDIVTNINMNAGNIVQYCQIPDSFIEFSFDGWIDSEAPLERYEAAIGSDGKISNIQQFLPITKRDKILITNLKLTDGSEVSVTVLAFNKAGLYGQATSNSVIVSRNPHLEVIDGSSNTDKDYQTSLNRIQGHWKYSDRCKITKAEWSVVDIAGNVLFDFTPLSYASTQFYSDTLTLTNGFTYINIIKTVDALNRTIISRSDGIAVKIDPPLPGVVRDGDGDDFDYQESVNYLFANWDPFGDPKSGDPTQKIQKYEIAVGTDIRYPETKSNVHHFVHVGLNTSYSFENLNLTEKTVTYFITVRAYSYAHSIQEESSDGIKVGFEFEISPGIIEHNIVQSYTDKLYVSWSGFQADMGIKQFQVGVSTTEPINLLNMTLDCEMYHQYLPHFDTVPLHVVGVNRFTEMTNLTLLHAHKYYITVIAMDSTDLCLGNYGPEILIDVTPPEAGKLHFPGGVGPNVAFVSDSADLEITWTEFIDPESFVNDYSITLYSGTTCFDNGYIDSTIDSTYSTIRTAKVTNDSKTVFYDLQLSEHNTYLVSITAKNGAGLERTVRSLPIKIDTTPPGTGDVKIGTNWKTDIKFQSETNLIKGVVAVAHTMQASKCERQIQIFPAEDMESMESLGYDFNPSCLNFGSNKLSMVIRHDDQLQDIIKGGIKFSSKEILEGNYSAVIKAAAGHQIVTSWFLASSFEGIFSEFDFHPPDNDTYDQLEGIDIESESPTTEVGLLYTEDENLNMTTDSSDFTKSYGMTTPSVKNKESTITTLKTTSSPDRVIHQKNNTNSSTGNRIIEHYGIGFHIPGYQFQGLWYGFIWARDKYKTVTRQVELEFDPTKSGNEFVVNLKKMVTPTSTTWSIQIYLNGNPVGQFNGVGFKEHGVSGIYTWNKDDYFQPVVDILHPFFGEAVVTSLTVPVPNQDEMRCSHGMPFYDGESNLKELWIGVSDHINSTDSVSPMTRFKTFCHECVNSCNIGCEKSCPNPHPDEFELIDIKANNISLIPTTLEGDNLQAYTYYINVKAVNYAGQETLAQSEGVMVDITPPTIQYVRCVDPSNSMDQPSDYQGTNSSMGAYWECSEDVGDIVDYTIQIGTQPGSSDVKNRTSVGLAKKLRVDGLVDKLRHGHTYWFTVTVINSAGLTSNGSCNITIDIKPPDISNVTLGYMFNDGKLGKTLLTTESQAIGLEWDGGRDDVEFYEWEIGSEPETDDVFPRIKVGITESRKALIKDGRLWIDDTRLNVTVGDYANKTHYNESIGYYDDTFFRLEPGKCVYVTLYAVSRSHLSSIVESNPICVHCKFNTGSFGSSDSQFSLETSNNRRKREGNSVIDQVVLQDHNTLESATFDIKGENVEILGGVLNITDVTSDYGTAASFKYQRYLVDPTSTLDDTSRFLRNRIKKPCGLKLYISPSSSLEYLTQMSISVKFNTCSYDTTKDQPAFVYWDKEDQMWKHPLEVCDNIADKIDHDIGSLVTEACKDVYMKSLPKITSRNKRSVQLSNIPVPRMWALFVVSKEPMNSKPVITTSELFISEDMLSITILPSGRAIYQQDYIHDIDGYKVIQYSDNEHDNVEFNITQQPMHGYANITSNGGIYYEPDKDFNGVDYVHITASETDLSPPLSPLWTEKKIAIHVKPMNDAPKILPFESSFKIEEKDNQGKIVINIFLESNVTKPYDVGHVTVYDADLMENSDQIYYTTLINNTELSNYSFIEQGLQVTSEKKLTILLSVDQTFVGKTTFNVRAFDSHNFTSKSLEINTYILIAPCNHGFCVNRTSTSCDSMERAVSFEKYFCQCNVGYTGEWCQTEIIEYKTEINKNQTEINKNQTEINQCSQNPCDTFHDCHDLIDGYECKLNWIKTFALTLGVVLVIFLIVVFNIRIHRPKQVKKNPDLNLGPKQRSQSLIRNEEHEFDSTDTGFINRAFTPHGDGEHQQFSQPLYGGQSRRTFSGNSQTWGFNR